MNYFIQNAWAAAPGAPAGNAYGTLFLIVGFVIIFYFLLWRPQSKRAKQHRELIEGLNKGDEVITNGGLIGRISKVADDFVIISIADNVDVRIQKMAITATLPKGSIKAD